MSVVFRRPTSSVVRPPSSVVRRRPSSVQATHVKYHFLFVEIVSCIEILSRGVQETTWFDDGLFMLTWKALTRIKAEFSLGACCNLKSVWRFREEY